MESIQIRNLRALGDTNEVFLKPITLLLGANSTGKSTFIKVFPLFRQSVETKTRGPVLWFGNLVDFGGHLDAQKIGTEGEGISFAFRIKTPQLSNIQSPWFRLGEYMSLSGFDARIELTLKSQNETTYISGYKIQFLDDYIEFDFNYSGHCIKAKVNQTDFLEKTKNKKLIAYGQIFQQFGEFDDNNNNVPLAARGLFRGGYTDAFENILLRHCSSYFDGRTLQERRATVLRRIAIGTPQEMLKQLEGLPNQDGKWNRRIRSLNIESEEYISLRNTIILARLPRLLTYADQYLVKTFSKIQYIKPLRATAERFYRGQNLAIDEIEADGGNLAMFLRSLSNDAQENFAQWTMTELGFSVKAHLSGSHVSLRLSVKGSDKSLNLADLGFGFSQILPVVAQIWHISRLKPPEETNSTRRLALPASPRIIAIEQPELHLHPAMQALVVDLIARIVNFAKQKPDRFVFILETHSETIVNRIGQLITSNVISKDDAQVLIFEKKIQDDESSVRQATYSADGSLLNWPYGFFLPNPNFNHATQD